MRSLKSESLTSPGSPVSRESMPATAPAKAAFTPLRPGSWRAWLLAARVPTLSAAVAPVLVGTAAAASESGTLDGLVFAATLAASLLIQIGTNFANDLYDFRKGADTQQRLGPVRVTQTGLLSEAEVARGTLAVFGLAVLLGAYLASVGGWPVVVIGLASVASGVLYTAGPWPLGYHGLGDLFVFVFFGLVAVCGTYYLQAGTLTRLAVLASVPVGLTVTNILVVNNLRDIETDRASGKRTLAVRIGERATRLQYAFFAAVAYAMPLVMWMAGETGPLFWLPYLTLPVAWRLARRVMSERGPSLNAALKATSRLHLLLAALLSLALLGPRG